MPTFSENGCFPGINILTSFIIRSDNSSGKRNNSSRHVVKREHHAVSEEVIVSPVLRLAYDSNIFQYLQTVPILYEILHSYITIRSIANSIFCKHLICIIVTAFFKEALRLRDIALVELCGSSNGYTARFKQFIRSVFFRSRFLFRKLNISELASYSQCLVKSYLVVFLQKVQNVSMLTTHETMIRLSSLINHHRRMTIIMERTDTLIVNARLLKINIGAYYVNNIKFTLDIANEV